MNFSPRRAAVVLAAALSCALGQATTAHAIIGGAPAHPASYPWLGAIGSPAFATRPGGQFCAGSLIAPDRVLTAAHCALTAKGLPFTTVTFGRGDVAAGGGITVPVTDIRLHPKFSIALYGLDLAYRYDVAILVLKTPVNLPTVKFGVPHGHSATIVGWGATSEPDQSNTALRSATVPLLSDDRCITPYGDQYDPSTALCAGSPTADTGEYDSGGPLLVDGELVGITSWAKGDGEPGYPGVYQRIPPLNF
ncbi:MAG: serine protease [Nocardia sp.]|nr:serine protease [Nocardia sp.]